MVGPLNCTPKSNVYLLLTDCYVNLVNVEYLVNADIKMNLTSKHLWSGPYYVSGQCYLFIPLKTGNPWYSYVFMGYRKGTIGLKWVQMFRSLFDCDSIS